MSSYTAHSQVEILVADLSRITAAEQDYLGVLSQAELARWRAYRVDSARRQFLAGRVLLRRALSERAPFPPESWVFETGPFGKPKLKEQGFGLRFNLSHTDGLVACAISTHYELGVDVEHMERRLDPLRLAEHSFAQTEINYLRHVPLEMRRAEFLRIWTLKEAYIKAKGVGLTIPLDSFWFEGSDTDARIVDTSHTEILDLDWHFLQFSPTAQHRLALAVSCLGGGVTVSVRPVAFSDQGGLAEDGQPRSFTLGKVAG